MDAGRGHFLNLIVASQYPKDSAGKISASFYLTDGKHLAAWKNCDWQ
jgi:hypothetical protein